jgi:glycosyltransferase involved in cell wall biosynthesis
MKVTLACNTPADDKLGTPKIVLREAEQLERLGVEVDRVFRESLPRPWSGRPADLTAPVRVAAALLGRAKKSDVVDIAGWDAWAYASIPRLARGRQAVVCRSNGLWARVLPTEPRPGGRLKQLGRNAYQSAVFLHWEKASIRSSHFTRVLSSPDRDDIVLRGWKAADRIAVVNPAADEAFDSEVPLEERDGVVFMGSWLARKGKRAAAAALSRLLVSRPELVVSVLGAGFPESVVRDDFDAAVRERVKVVPVATPAELARAIAVAKVLVFPTLYEGFGLVVLEGMRAGLAVVTTPTGAGIDAVRDGETGLVVPVDDDTATENAVRRLLDDDPLRRRLAQAGRATARERTWRRSAEELLRCYEAALRVARDS